MWVVNHKYKYKDVWFVECGLYTIAYAIFSDDIVEQFAMGHAYIARTKKIQGNVNAQTQREKTSGKNKKKNKK